MHMCSIVVLKVTGTGFCQNGSLISRLVFRPCFASVIVFWPLSISLLFMKVVLFFFSFFGGGGNYFASVILIWQ